MPAEKMQERGEYESRVANELDKLAKQIDTWSGKVDELSGQAQEQARGALQQARKQYEETRVQLNLLRKESEGSWKTLKVGVENALHDLKTSLDEAAAPLKGK